jgi:isoleucyl-tRNA synthetase
MKAVAASVEKLDAAAIARLERGESVEVDGETLSGDDITLTRQALAGNASETLAGVTVVLDTHVTPELAAEGLAREVISRIQNLRKEADLAVSQRIQLFVDAQGPVGAMLDSDELRSLILRETLGVALERAAVSAFPERSITTREAIDGESFSVGLLPA